MIAKARARAEENDWANVTLIMRGGRSQHQRHADAAVFHFTHDLMQTPAALRTRCAASTGCASGRDRSQVGAGGGRRE